MRKIKEAFSHFTANPTPSLHTLSCVSTIESFFFFFSKPHNMSYIKYINIYNCTLLCLGTGNFLPFESPAGDVLADQTLVFFTHCIIIPHRTHTLLCHVLMLLHRSEDHGGEGNFPGFCFWLRSCLQILKMALKPSTLFLKWRPVVDHQ